MQLLSHYCKRLLQSGINIRQGAPLLFSVYCFGDWWLVPLRFAKERQLIIHSLGGNTWYFAAL